MKPPPLPPTCFFFTFQWIPKKPKATHKNKINKSERRNESTIIFVFLYLGLTWTHAAKVCQYWKDKLIKQPHRLIWGGDRNGEVAFCTPHPPPPVPVLDIHLIASHLVSPNFVGIAFAASQVLTLSQICPIIIPHVSDLSIPTTALPYHFFPPHDLLHLFLGLSQGLGGWRGTGRQKYQSQKTEKERRWWEPAGTGNLTWYSIYVNSTYVLFLFCFSLLVEHADFCVRGYVSLLCDFYFVVSTVRWYMTGHSFKNFFFSVFRIIM